MALNQNKENALAGIESAFSQIQTIDKIENEKNNEKKVINELSDEQATVSFKISKQKHIEYNKYFGSKGIKLSQGIRMCLDYVKYLEEQQKIIFRDSGIQENEMLKLK